MLQMATALIFNEDEKDYHPITVLLDSGAQRSFIKADLAEQLKLPILSCTSLTTTGMGELHETFVSKEVLVTLKSLHNSNKLKRVPIYTKEKLSSKT